jgi:hypothetical protein
MSRPQWVVFWSVVWAPLCLAVQQSVKDELARLLPDGCQIVAIDPAVAPIGTFGGKRLGQVLYVSPGGTIEEREFVKGTKGIEWGRIRALGKAVDLRQHPILEGLVPADEVPFEIRGFRSWGLEYFLLLTRTLSRYSPRAAGSVFIIRIYCVNAEGEMTRVVVEEGDLFLTQVEIVDLGHDRKGVAIAGRGETGISVWLSIWLCERGWAQKIGFSRYKGFWPRVESTDPLVIVTFREEDQLPAARYRWDPRAKRFVELQLEE